ncbi:MAG: diacylglycerol kinase family protein [Bacteroidales bacterium]|jgi:YegS/Rv2252/BmrU family lipid kinase|nr:diacylglycerol kinase family protein [Bacteroidales bacterium]
MPDPASSKALFILNPNAGIPPIKFFVSEELKRRRDELSYYKSLSIDESGTLIKNNFDKYKIFIAAGGDGTVHTIAARLAGTGKLLGVLPIGSGNGFARELGFRPNIRSLLKDIERNESFDIDMLTINDDLCLNVAGVGLDSFVAHSFDKLGTRGFWSYVWVTIGNFIRLRPFHAEIRVEGGETISEDLFVLVTANTRQFGNYAFIAPEAVPNDGMLDIVMLRPFPKYLFPVFIYRLFARKLNRSKYYRHIRTDREVTVSTPETRFHIDGEPVTIKGDIKINVRKNALKVLKTRHNKFA